MPASLQSPNTGNYFVGKGVIQFKPSGDSDYYYVGNVTSMEFEPTLETLEHFSSMEGVKSKDVTVVLEKGGTISLAMEELTARNLAMFLLGDVDITDPLAPEVEIFSSNLLSGALKFIGTNEVGPRWTFDFAQVDFVPSGSFNPISDEWGALEVSGELATVAGSFGTAYLTNVEPDTAPVNLGLPDYTGVLVEGFELTAFVGVWTGDANTYTYVWEADGTPIGGATSSTFTLTATEIGTVITVVVDATNSSGGPVSAESPEQEAVIAASTA